MPKNPVAVKSIVSTPLADAIAAHYGVEMRNVLTGFKWIGDQIANAGGCRGSRPLHLRL